MLMEPPAPLLPATLGKLKRVAQGDVGDGLDAGGCGGRGGAEGGWAEAVCAVGLCGGAGNGAPEATVTVYKFMDASGAISAYDYFRKPGMRPEKLGDDAVSNRR